MGSEPHDRGAAGVPDTAASMVLDGAAPLSTADGMKQKVAKATFWAALETAGAQGFAFLFFVVFARILSPHDFGVYALAMAIVGAVNMILFQGFGDGLIQADRLDSRTISTAFWTNMLLAVGMVAALQVLAYFAVDLFHEPMLGPVISWLSLLCIPRALVSVHSALFRRTLDLRVFAIRTIAGAMVGGLVGVVLALCGFGVWALVISQFVQSVLIVIVMWRSTKWRPSFAFSGTAFRKLLGFTGHFMAASVITSCIDDLGSVLIGLNMDLSAVGYFSVALRVIRAAIVLVMTPLQLVMMPALSRIAHDRQRFGAAYSEMVITTSIVWLPLVTGLGLAARDLIPLVFGPQWIGAVAPIQAMCFAAITMPLWTFTGQALSALGRPDSFARMAYIQLGLYCVAFPLAAQFGIVAVGWTWAGLSALMVPVSLFLLTRLSGLEVGRLLAVSARIDSCGMAMVAAFLLVREMLPPGIWSLVLACLIGVAAYGIAFAGLLPGRITRLVALCRSALPNVDAKRARAL
jgi:O-antigen/teichoic acid export membrane protein